MIETRDCNIFDQKDIDVIIQQCNCFNTMGAGFAKEIKARYPEAFDADNRTKRGDVSKLGSYTCGVGKDGKHIINMYGQYRYGRDKCYTDYEAVRKALQEFKDDYVTPSPPVVFGIPYKMGCNLGGGDWEIVCKILHDLFFEDDNFKLVICRK